MIIAPCSREIKYGSNGCFVRDPNPFTLDDSNNMSDIKFNQPTCSYLTTDFVDLPIECQNILGYEIDPSYYIEYYNNSSCRGLAIDMIKIIIDIVNRNTIEI